MKNFLYILFVLLLVSCYNQHKPEKPENLISKTKMINVIIDMSVYSSAKGVNKKVLEKNGIKLQEQIYRKHKIDSAQFANSNYYYAYSPKEYEEIYKKVRDSLIKLKAKYVAIELKESKEKKKRDSIKRRKLKETPRKDSIKVTTKNLVSKKSRKKL